MLVKLVSLLVESVCLCVCLRVCLCVYICEGVCVYVSVSVCPHKNAKLLINNWCILVQICAMVSPARMYKNSVTFDIDC